MWDKITIKKYYELHTITKMVKDPVELNIRMLACFKDVDVKEIEKLTVKQLTKELRVIDFLKELPTNEKLPLSFHCKGSSYKAIILSDGMTGGQFIDFTSICKDEKPEDTIYHMHELLGAMCVKREWQMKYPFVKYEYKGWEKNAEVFHEHMTMDLAYPFYVFFCKVLTNLQKPMLDYSLQKLKKELKIAKRLSKKLTPKETTTLTGVGI